MDSLINDLKRIINKELFDNHIIDYVIFEKMENKLSKNNGDI